MSHEFKIINCQQNALKRGDGKAPSEEIGLETRAIGNAILRRIYEISNTPSSQASPSRKIRII